MQENHIQGHYYITRSCLLTSDHNRIVLTTIDDKQQVSKYPLLTGSTHEAEEPLKMNPERIHADRNERGFIESPG